MPSESAAELFKISRLEKKERDEGDETRKVPTVHPEPIAPERVSPQLSTLWTGTPASAATISLRRG